MQGTKALSVSVGSLTLAAGEDEVKWDFSGEEDEAIVGGQGKVGHTTKPKAAFVEVTVHFDDGQSADQLTRLARGQTVTVECRDRTLTLYDAIVAGSVEVGGDKRSASLRFEGARGKEVR